MAVDDIKGVQENAVLKRLSILVENTLEVEYRLPKCIRSRLRFLRNIQFRSIKPNLYRNRHMFVKWWKSEPFLNTKAIKETIKPQVVSYNQDKIIAGKTIIVGNFEDRGKAFSW